MVENHKYINQSLINKDIGISKNHKLIEFIEEVESKYELKILDVIKIERPIHKDYQINIITDTKEDARKLNSDNKNQLVLKKIFQKHYNEECSTEVESLERIIENQLYSEVKNFISERYLPVWNLQPFHSNFIFFLWSDYDAKRMTLYKEQIEFEINQLFWSMENYNYLTQFRIKVTFDSKEKLDNKHNGSFRSYFD